MRVHRVVIGLIAGLALGSALGAIDGAVALRVAALLQPIGDLWVNAIRMTIVPLVVALLFVSVAARETRGRLGTARDHDRSPRSWRFCFLRRWSRC